MIQPLDRVSRLEGVAELVIWSPLSGALWYYALFHRRLKCLWAASGGRAAHRKGGNAQKIKSKYITWHTRIRRLVRRAVYCSKTQRMHDVELGLFINEDEFGVAVW